MVQTVTCVKISPKYSQRVSTTDLARFCKLSDSWQVWASIVCPKLSEFWPEFCLASQNRPAKLIQWVYWVLFHYLYNIGHKTLMPWNSLSNNQLICAKILNSPSELKFSSTITYCKFGYLYKYMTDHSGNNKLIHGYTLFSSNQVPCKLAWPLWPIRSHNVVQYSMSA